MRGKSSNLKHEAFTIFYWKKYSNCKFNLELDDSGKSSKFHIVNSRNGTEQFIIKVQLDCFFLVTRTMSFEQF